MLATPSKVRNLNFHEFEQMIEFAEREGWNPGLEDKNTFFYTDPKGFFCYESNGDILGFISSVRISNDFGFIGYYLVNPDYRNRGIGMLLSKRAKEYIGDRTIGIEGVLDMVPYYKKIGFIHAYRTERYVLKNKKIPFNSFNRINKIEIENLPELISYDLIHYPSIRANFLKNWVIQKKSYAFYYKTDKINGYIVARKSMHGYRIGPLFAGSFEIAKELLFTICNLLDTGESIYIDTPKPNLKSKELVEIFENKQEFNCERMYMNGFPDLPLDYIYGTTSLELG